MNRTARFAAVAATVVGAFLATAGAATAAEPTPPIGAATVQPVRSACPELDDCYGPDEMSAFGAEAVRQVNRYAQQMRPDVPLPLYRILERGTSATSSCVDGYGDPEADENAAFYCSADQTVYLGEEALWTFYGSYGDAAAMLVVAHEWGHHLQFAGGGPEATDLELENQADCIGGSFLGELAHDGTFRLRDVADIARILPDSSENGPDRTHGSLTERTSAVALGAARGLTACDRYVPGSDLATTF